MIDDFMDVLEGFPIANLHSKGARKRIAEALVGRMCEKHIINYTDLDAVKKDPVMMNFIENFNCTITKDDNQMEFPFNKGL